jgi:hypothetical protein
LADVEKMQAGRCCRKNGQRPKGAAADGQPAVLTKPRAAGDLFGEEGDVSEVDVLVDANEALVRRTL